MRISVSNTILNKLISDKIITINDVKNNKDLTKKYTFLVINDDNKLLCDKIKQIKKEFIDNFKKEYHKKYYTNNIKTDENLMKTIGEKSLERYYKKK